MFKISADKSIYLTRGDVATINVTAKNSDGTNYIFKSTDVVRLNIFQKSNCHEIVLTKDAVLEEDKEEVSIYLSSTETKIGELISKPVDYWYEIVLNPETAPQTLIGYLEQPAIFKLLPEGGDTE